MKNNYKINIDPPKLSKEDIEKHMDFDALLEAYEETPQPIIQKEPPLIRRLLPYGTAIAAVLAGALFWFQLGGEAVPTEKEYFAEQPFINPPIQDYKPKFASYKMNADKGGVYQYKDSKVTIPANAFIDENGNAIKGEIELKYREYHDFVDIFLSGIPMDYDSAGTRYQLESSGMMEVLAEQNGQKINLKEGKQLAIELASNINVKNFNVSPKYNIYRLDTERRNWVYEAKDEIEITKVNSFAKFVKQDNENVTSTSFETILNNINETFEKEKIKLDNNRKNALTAFKNQYNTQKPIRPVKPRRATSDNYVFDFDFSIDYFNEHEINLDEYGNELPSSRQEKIDLYKNTLWQVADNQVFTKEMQERQWEDLKFKKINDRDFSLTLYDGDYSTTIIVHPILMGQDYKDAIARYEAKLKQFETISKEWTNKLENKEAELEAEYTSSLKALETVKKEQLEAFNDEDKAYNCNIINRFTVNQLGIWNCDRPIKGSRQKVSTTLVNEKSEKIKTPVAYMADELHNTVYRFYTAKEANLQYKEKAKNVLWTVLPKGEIAVLKGDSTMNKKTLRLNTSPIKSEAELRKALEF